MIGGDDTRKELLNGRQPTAREQDTTRGGEEIMKKSSDCDYRKEDIEEERRKSSVRSSENARNEFFDETCQPRGVKYKRNEDSQKHTSRREFRSNLPSEENNEKSVRNVGTKQQVEARSKEEKMTKNSISLRF